MKRQRFLTSSKIEVMSVDDDLSFIQIFTIKKNVKRFHPISMKLIHYSQIIGIPFG